MAAAELLKPKPRGPQKKPRKTSTTIRLDVEVLEAFKAMGKGWQTRMNKVFKDYVKSKKRNTGVQPRRETPAGLTSRHHTSNRRWIAASAGALR
jgi:hypothetical protein